MGVDSRTPKSTTKESEGTIVDLLRRIENNSKETLNDILEKEFKVLDKGFIRVVDFMGNDSSIVRAARVSYGKGTKTLREDEKLINYLLSHDHGTPFEMAQIVFHIKCPIFVMRQWIRHRIGNSFNEYSARYSEIKEEFYEPELSRVQKQHKSKKQCSAEALPEDTAKNFLDDSRCVSNLATDIYNHYNAEDISLAREINRINLPVSNYTEFYWSVNLRSLMHFIKLRNDSHAQYEIQEYAKILQEIMGIWCPLATKAFVEHQQSSIKFSKTEKEKLKELIQVFGDDSQFKEILKEYSTILTKLGAVSE